MNRYLKGLLSSVADNDIQKAKKYAMAIIENEKAKCNQNFVTNIKAKLNAPSMNMIELPHNIKGLLSIEDVSMSFNESRYVLSKSDSEVVDKILSTWKVNDKLIEYGIRYLNSALFYGESGCGKTMLGRYIAYKAGLPFAYMNFSGVVSSYLGKTGSNIAEVFNYVSKIKCVFMIDEIDAIGLMRGTETISEMSRVVINLMQCLDSFDCGTIVLGATNREDMIDPALKRRFALHHQMNLPSKDIRVSIAKRYLESIPDAEYSEDDIENFANITEGYSCVKIVNLLVGQVVDCLTKNKKITLSGINLRRESQ